MIEGRHNPRGIPEGLGEIDEHFASQRTIYVCLIDADGAGNWGRGGGGSLSGRAVIISPPSENFDTGLIAHELMHTFGLHHSLDLQYQAGQAESEWDSACRTEWLAVHRYLNPTQRSDDVSSPSVRMLPQVLSLHRIPFASALKSRMMMVSIKHNYSSHDYFTEFRIYKSLLVSD